MAARPGCPSKPPRTSMHYGGRSSILSRPASPSRTIAVFPDPKPKPTSPQSYGALPCIESPLPKWESASRPSKRRLPVSAARIPRCPHTRQPEADAQGAPSPGSLRTPEARSVYLRSRPCPSAVSPPPPPSLCVVCLAVLSHGRSLPAPSRFLAHRCSWARSSPRSPSSCSPCRSQSPPRGAAHRSPPCLPTSVLLAHHSSCSPCSPCSSRPPPLAPPHSTPGVSAC